MFELRTLCLERRFSEFSALVRLMATPDEAALDHAVQAAQGLRPIDACGDVPTLVERERWLQLPDDPAAVVQVQRLVREVTEVSALEKAGRLEKGLARSADLIGQAQVLGHLPTLAEAFHVHGRLLEQSGRVEEALDALWSSVLAAERAGQDEVRAESLVHYLYVTSAWMLREHDFDRVSSIAEALVERVAPESRLQGQLLNSLAIRHDMQNRPDKAEVLYRKSLEMLERVFGTEDAEVAFLRSNLGSLLLEEGRITEAYQLLQDANEQIASQLGKSHPSALVTQINLADVLLVQQRYDEAQRLLEEAIRAYEKVIDPENAMMAWPYSIRGELRLAMAQIAPAIEDLEQAVRLAEKGQISINKVRSHFALARALWHVEAEHERALREAKLAADEAERAGHALLPAIKAWIAERSVDDGVASTR